MNQVCNCDVQGFGPGFAPGFGQGLPLNGSYGHQKESQHQAQQVLGNTLVKLASVLCKGLGQGVGPGFGQGLILNGPDGHPNNQNPA